MASTQSISADFPFKSNYVEVHGSKMHYVEEGEGDPILFLHGNPTSSYLWRNIIPYVSSKGRAIALDLIGMGRSDKPDLDYRFFDHVKYVEGFIEKLGLENITFVIHDWGSALGFHYARRHEGNVKALAFMEAILRPVPNREALPKAFQELLKVFRAPEVGWDAIVNKNMFVEQVLPGAIVRPLTEEEMNHYRAPFLDPPSRKPLWRWPNEIPIAGEPADVAEAAGAYNAWLQQTELPKLLFYASPGAIILPPVVEWCKQNLKNLKTVDLGHGIHFLQEDHPHRIGAELAAWYDGLG
ncbi:MAG: haloalkane dehalogenase [Candidatus Acidiferrales bacterium]